jgi:hypothetical protein
MKLVCLTELCVRVCCRDEFLRRADAGCSPPDGSLPSPVIPSGYDRIAKWHVDAGLVTREQLAMAAVLMSRQAVRHPYALTKRAVTLDEVLTSPAVGLVTNRLECARRADGGAALVVASSRFMREHNLLDFNMNKRDKVRAPVIIGGGEASGPLYPPPIIDEEMFSCEQVCAVLRCAVAERVIIIPLWSVGVSVRVGCDAGL